MYVNADCMLLANKDKKYRKILNGADLVYADGVGVVYAAKLWGHSLPGRSTAADFMPDFCCTFAERGLRLFFLGAPDGVAEKAAEKLRQQIPNLNIVGTHHGYFSPAQSGEIISRINATKPDIVVVGFGAPYQEVWIHDNAHLFDTTVLWGVGGLFDFLSGRIKRGPQWLLDHGFEWLCRLLVEPRRLWRRYLLGNTKFVLYVLGRRFQDFFKTIF
jgi:N-acetylglucosaminyldiphosphoundecaprenol N-acetyl-beta-D-mannosaminyltransferase